MNNMDYYRGVPIFNSKNECQEYVNYLNNKFKFMYHWVGYDEIVNKYFICYKHLKNNNSYEKNMLIII